MKKNRQPFQPKPIDAGFALSGTVLINVILSLGVTLVLAFMAVFMALGGQYGSPDEAVAALENDMGIQWFLQILLHFCILAGGLIYLVIRRADIGKEMGYKRFMSWKDLLMTVAYTFSYILIMLPVNAVYIALLEAMGMDLSSSASSSPMFASVAGIILGYFAIACIPPFSEELMFRGLAVNGLKKLGKWPAVLLSALCFAFMHMNPVQYLNAFCGGIVMGLVYWKTKSIWSSAIVHFINNAVSVTESVLIEVNQVTDQMLNSFLEQHAWVAVVFLLLILSALAGIVLCTLYFGRERRPILRIRAEGQVQPGQAPPLPMNGMREFGTAAPVLPETVAQPVYGNPTGGAPCSPVMPPYAPYGMYAWGLSPAQWAAQQERARNKRDLLIGFAVAVPGIVVCLLMTLGSFL